MRAVDRARVGVGDRQLGRLDREVEVDEVRVAVVLEADLQVWVPPVELGAQRLCRKGVGEAVLQPAKLSGSGNSHTHLRLGPLRRGRK